MAEYKIFQLTARTSLIQDRTPQQQQQMMQKMQAQQNGQVMQGNQQMERQGSQMDNMSGPRSGSPGSGDAPSPKRQRIEGNMQTMNQGRPGQPGQMQGNQVGPLSDIPDPALLEQTRELLRKKNIDPDSVPPQVLRNLTMQPTNVQAGSVEVYSSSMQHNMQQQMQAAMNNSLNKSNVNKGIPPNMAPGGAQGSPMSQAGMDGATGEFYAAANGGGRMPMQANAAAAAAGAAGQAGNNNGNHALQDYQMQLMLLEQQNKKRLLMARQEQDNMTHPAGVGPNGAFAPQGMSPQGSQRGGDPSPNPNDIQRGELERSEEIQTRPHTVIESGSPLPGMIDPSQMPPQMRAQMMAQAQNGQMVGRPPSSNPMANMTPQQMEMLRQQQGAQMANGQFHPGGPQQGQMMQGGQPGPGGQPMGTPRQASNMPPPPAPQANAGGTGPSSPAQQPPPPTPTQQNKAKPGAKKETAKKVSITTKVIGMSQRHGLTKSQGAAAKKNAPNATPASEAEQPPTPTPATPITPMNAASFNKNQQLPNGQPAPTSAQANAAQANSQQQSQQASQNATANAAQQQAPPSTVDSMAPFGNLDPDGFAGMPLDFSIGDNGDVLDNFDFDSFLNQDNEMGLNWDASVFGDAIDTGGLEGN